MLPAVLSGLFKVAVTAVLAFAVYSAYVHFFAGRDYEEVPSLPMQEQAAPAPEAAAPSVKPEAEAKAPAKKPTTRKKAASGEDAPKKPRAPRKKKEEAAE
jgi:hypothetical protein